MDWMDYDPEWLAELAREQHPDQPDLAGALARCTRARRDGRAYLRFVEADTPAWRFERSVTLESRREGTLVLDVLQDGRVGGVEFLRRV